VKTQEALIDEAQRADSFRQVRMQKSSRILISFTVTRRDKSAFSELGATGTDEVVPGDVIKVEQKVQSASALE